MNTHNWKVPDSKAYEKIIGAFRKHKTGITLSDVAAGTGLSLAQVKSLVPLAADEYSARLEVTESSEILYSFPDGFVSRYRGLVPALNRFFSSFMRFGAKALILLFKAWIMIMLVGYFLLFMAIALAALIVSVSGSSNSKNRNSGRGGVNFSFGFFDLIFRLWFYSELLGSGRRRYGDPYRNTGRRAGGLNSHSEEKYPLHKAIFSFVFGDDDPNRGSEIIERKEFVSYLRNKKGVVSLPELMILTGQSPGEAERYIMNLCAEFGGIPEATEDGTVVYRFEEILFSGENKNTETSLNSITLNSVSESPLPVYKKLKSFSSNPKKMNICFGLINTVNLVFGGYFLYSAATIGRIVTEAALQNSGLYGYVYYFLAGTGSDPIPIIRTVLGLVPLLFSALFWIIPGIRSWFLKKDNDTLRFINFRGFGFGKIWNNPHEVRFDSLKPGGDELFPKNLKEAQNFLVKELSGYSAADVSIDEKQNEVFSFPQLLHEKSALQKYRQSVDTEKSKTGKIIFDSTL